MKQVCYHCKEIKDCELIGKNYLCEEHRALKQYKQKEKKVYELRRTPIKQKAYAIKKTSLNKKPHKIKPHSEKQKKINAEKLKVYEQLREQREQVCTGCGAKQCLTHSHLIPVSQRKDLEIEPLNITYHCICCHTIWEHDVRGRRYLLDYTENMDKIKKLDNKFYNRILNKLEG